MIGFWSAPVGVSVLSLARGEKNSKHPSFYAANTGGNTSFMRARENPESGPKCLSRAIRAQGKTRKRSPRHPDSSKGRP